MHVQRVQHAAAAGLRVPVGYPAARQLVAVLPRSSAHDTASRRFCRRFSGSLLGHDWSRSIRSSPFSATRTSKRLILYLSGRAAAARPPRRRSVAQLLTCRRGGRDAVHRVDCWSQGETLALDKAATRAAQQLRFLSGTRSGEPVAVRTTLEFAVTLRRSRRLLVGALGLAGSPRAVLGCAAGGARVTPVPTRPAGGFSWASASVRQSRRGSAQRPWRSRTRDPGARGPRPSCAIRGCPSADSQPRTTGLWCRRRLPGSARPRRSRPARRRARGLPSPSGR